MLLDVVIGLPQWLDVFARVLNWAVWSVFLVVLIVVLVRAPTPWKALKANPVLPLIVVLTTPFAPAGLQMFRLLRLGALLGAAHHAKRLFSTQGLCTRVRSWRSSSSAAGSSSPRSSAAPSTCRSRAASGGRSSR